MSSPKPRASRSASGVAGDGAGPEATTRERMIEAAISSILEVGFYEASARSIARRAGLTWGAIQRQFGSREGLLLAAFEDGLSSMVSSLGSAVIDTSSPANRARSLFDAVSVYYRRPAVLAEIEILMHLRAKPETSEAALKAVEKLTKEAEVAIRDVIDRAVPPGVDPEVASFAVNLVRDFWLGHHITAVTAMPEAAVRRTASDANRGEIIIQVIALCFEDSELLKHTPERHAS